MSIEKLNEIKIQIESPTIHKCQISKNENEFNFQEN